jgi:hypothetical protein
MVSVSELTVFIFPSARYRWRGNMRQNEAWESFSFVNRTTAARTCAIAFARLDSAISRSIHDIGQSSYKRHTSPIGCITAA